VAVGLSRGVTIGDVLTRFATFHADRGLVEEPIGRRLSYAQAAVMVDRMALSAGVISFPEDATTASDLMTGIEALLVLGPTEPAGVRTPST
jgi:hypothetical protein